MNDRTKIILVVIIVAILGIGYAIYATRSKPSGEIKIAAPLISYGRCVCVG